MPEAVKKLVVYNVNEVEKVAATVDFVFSAVDMTKDEIKAIEEAYAKTETPVVSNNSAHRWTPDVPMMVPEINADHARGYRVHRRRDLEQIEDLLQLSLTAQSRATHRYLAALKEFEPYEVVVATTYQAISGAGKTFKEWPEMVGNIIPYIGGEEEKSEKEPLRIWGKVDKENGVIVPAEGISYHKPVYQSPSSQRTYSNCIRKVQKEPYKGAAYRGYGQASRARLRSLVFQVHQSSLSSTLRRTTDHRLLWTLTSRKVWVSALDVSVRIQYMTGSSLAFHTTL